MLQANVIETSQKSLERYEVKYILHSQAMCGSSHSTHQSATISQKSSEIHHFSSLNYHFPRFIPPFFLMIFCSAYNSNSIPMFGQLKWQLLCHFSPWIPFQGHLLPGQSRWKRDHSAGAHLWRGHTQRGAATGRGAGGWMRGWVNVGK